MWMVEKPKVMIIDDSVNSVLTIRNLLKQGNFAVISSCGDQGFDAAMSENPDIILLELLLKRENGFEILESLKNNLRTKNIPIVVVSDVNQQSYWEEAFRLGAASYLVKPDHYPYLLRKVNEIIHAKEKRYFIRHPKSLAVKPIG